MRAICDAKKAWHLLTISAYPSVTAISGGSAVGDPGLSKGHADYSAQIRVSPDDTRYVETPDGIRIHVAAAGPADGRRIVLLHGFPDCAHGWRRQVPALAAAGYRVLAPDLRGYARSGCPRGVGAYRLDLLVADVLAVGGPGSFDLVGHDWGGIIAFAVAARHPERVRALTVINAPHLDIVRGVMRRDRAQLVRSAYIAFFQLTGLAEAMLHARDYRLLERMLRATGRADTFTAEDIADHRRRWRRPGRLTAMLGYYRALVRRPHAALGRISVPTQILWGMHDPALGFALAEASLALCDHGQLHRFADASHWPQLDEPDAVAAAIASFHQVGDQ